MDELKSSSYSEKYPEYMNVSCQKANTGDAFPLGVQSYKWSIGSGTWWQPEKTFLVMRIVLENGAGGLLGDTPATAIAAPSMGLMSTLFQSVEFRVGGQTVQKLSNYVSQVDSLIHRTSMSKPYLDSIGEASDFWNESFTVRQAEVRDILGVDGRQALAFDLIFKPPLSLFHDNGSEPLPAATDYELLLQPQPPSQYKIGVVETQLEAGASPLTVGSTANDYAFTVEQLELQVATVQGPVFDSGTFRMKLANIECQTAKVQTTSLSQTYFTVHPKTSVLCVAYQDTRLANAYVSKTKYVVAPNTGLAYDPTKVSDNKALGLNRLFVQYDSLSRPSPDANPEYDPLSTDRTVQRYYESMGESNMLSNPAGCETLQEHQRRGPFYYFNWGRKATANGKTSGATRVQINQQFQSSTPVENMNVLLMSVHRNDVSVTVKNGQTMGISIE